MSAETMPQFAKNERPDVVETVEQYRADERSSKQRIIEFARKYSTAERPSAFAGIRSGWCSADGITGVKPEGHGQWKRSGRGWAPYKNNPIHKEFVATFAKLPTVPGLPTLVVSANHDYFMEPKPFTVGGVAYYGMARPSEPRDDYGTADAGWHEITASEYYAAKEAWIGGQS